MNVSRTALFLAVTLWACSPGVSAAQYSFDLDVPEGHYSFWRLDDVGLSRVVEVEFEINELRRHERWTPSFQFALEAETRRTALIFFGSAPGQPITVSVRSWEGDKVSEDVRLAGWSVAQNERVTVALDWSSPGSLAVRANGQIYGPFALRYAPKALAVGASSGQMLGHSLRLRDPVLDSLLEMTVDRSERVDTPDGIRRRLPANEVAERTHKVWNAFVSVILEPYERLTIAQRPAHLVFAYHSEVQNGGHYQYFENRTAVHLEETVNALRTWELGCQADVLTTAGRQWAERNRRPADSAAEFLGNAGEFEKLDVAYHKCRPTTDDELERHLQRHQSEFVIVAPE
jgi:hypothetical protein